MLQLDVSFSMTVNFLGVAEPVLWQPLQSGAGDNPIHGCGVDMRLETAGHLQLLT